MVVYFAHHDGPGGVLHEWPFATQPTAAQLATLVRLMAHRHGTTHPKTGRVYALSVVERRALSAGEAPTVDVPREDARPNRAELAAVTVSGTGHVANPPPYLKRI